MKILNLVLSASLLISILTACNLSDGSAGGSTTTTAVGAICDLSNSMTGALVACIEFQANSSDNQTACSLGGSEVQHYASAGVSSAVYLSTSGSGVSVSCEQNSTNPTVGTCTLSDRTIFYYSGTWTLQNASADCSTQDGQWGS